MRAAAKKLQELIRKNTLQKTNENDCVFDRSVKEMAMEEFDKRISLIRKR
jgi:hypothetical protein